MLKKSDPCPQVSFWGLVSKTYVRVHSNLHPAVHWGVALNVKNKQNPRNIFLKKGTVFVLWKVSLSLEDKTIPFSHLECLSSFLIGSPASCLVPIQSILHPESREILLKHKSGHLSLPASKLPKHIQHLPQTPSYDCAYFSDFISCPFLLGHPGSGHTCFLAA